MRHKHADLIHAWAEGAEIQVLFDSGWQDRKEPTWSTTCDYRIKPKEKVKKWKWVYKHPNGQLFVSEGFYKNAEVFLQYNPSCMAVESVKSTEIEVEE